MRSLGMLTLTAINRRFTNHRVPAVTLAAVLCHSDIVGAFLKTSKARPGHKGEESENGYPRYSQTMSFVPPHVAS
jgi:hypothetical protein